METEIRIIKDHATTVNILHPEASWGIFCYNSQGDLFLNSDWGFYGYMWRSFGDKRFEEFLSGINEDYLVGKLKQNHLYLNPKFRLGANQEKALKQLCREFIDTLKKLSNE